MVTNNIEQAKHIIGERVELFTRNLDQYRHPDYKEAQLRKEFLDPFFTALGWDVANAQGWAEQYKEVVNEDALKISGTTKAPDYSFRIGGARKFFAEAKKPARAIRADAEAAYQLRRYAWSAKLPLSVLSDFEELAIYDCRVRPAEGDKASVGRVNFITFDQYLDRLPEIYDVFSKEAVLRGSFDKYAQTGGRGTSPVDAEFLKEIEEWRVSLAKNIAQLNPRLTLDELNDAVQRTIDRIIFLRMAEDRGAEHYGRLLDLTKHGNIYPELLKLCHDADDKYNSGLFDFQTDHLTPRLKIDDDKLGKILEGLYYPQSPYEFSVLGADTLGNVYEQFLGKVIRLTSSHQARVEDKPEVKKAGGVYYTPTYIVDYIVKQTVGKLIEGKSPIEIEKFRVLDPACGSGSFLLGAYQLLLDHHLDWYANHHDDKQSRDKIYETQNGWCLTTAEKKRIVLNNIFGVDIDRQAVEVTKLSLLLKVLEGENQETLVKQLTMFHERALPNLDANIKCGNSLISSDYFAGQMFPDADEMRRVNPFDWERAFPQIFRDGAMAAGGFDAVIGNPPYVRQEGLKEAKDYFQNHYHAFQSTADLYIYFIEKGQTLLKPNGLFGMIISNKWLRAAYGKPLRRYLTDNVSLLQVIDMSGLPVFDATVRTIILITSPKSKRAATFRYLPPVSLEKFRTIRVGTDIEALVQKQGETLQSSGLSVDGWSLSNAAAQSFVDRIRQVSIPMNEYIKSKPYFGVKTGFNNAFVIDREIRDRLVKKNSTSAEIIKPLLIGRDVKRYGFDFNQRFLILTQIGVPIEKYPAVLEHLTQFRPQLQKRQDQGEHWWELRACDYYDKIAAPKIVYPDIAITPRFTLDTEGHFITNTIYFIPRSDLYLLGILNSKVGLKYFQAVCAGLEGTKTTYLRFFGQYMEGFPVRTINSSESADKSRHDQMVALVTEMLGLHKRLAETKTQADLEMYQRQIDATDSQIDALVYELYGLTEEEIKVVEGKTD